MEEISLERWGEFRRAIREHWPELTDAEVESTFGRKEDLKKLIMVKRNVDDEFLERKLDDIYHRVRSGNPQTFDESAGIDRAQQGSPSPHSNEWMAREDTNRP